MSNTAIRLKKSGVTGNTPSGLANGELALNYADGKLYYKNSLGGTSYITNQFSFDTINSNNSLILAGSGSDTLTFIPGDNVTINTDTYAKTITINASVPGGTDPGPAFDRANAAYTHANAAYDQANTGGDPWVRTQANSAYDTANLAYNQANTAYNEANNAYETANIGGSYANTAITNATAASLFANGAFVQANAAYDSQNTTYDFAGSAYIHANAAYAKANTGTTALDVNADIVAFTIAFS